MSTNTEIVTGAFRGFSDSDMEKFTADWSPEIVFDTTNYEGWPLDVKRVQGSEEVVMVFGSFMSSFRSLEIADPEVFELGERHALALYDEIRREHGSDEPLTRQNAIVFELGAGQIRQAWVFTDQERAKAFSREVSG